MRRSGAADEAKSANQMYDAAFAFIASKKIDEWSENEISDLLFLIANGAVDLVAERLGDICSAAPSSNK
jgi:hypothetical protein